MNELSHDDIVMFVEKETDITRDKWGAVSITFKHDSNHLTIYRSGRKIKGTASSSIIYNLSNDEAYLISLHIQKELSAQAAKRAKPTPVMDRIKIMNEVVETDKEVVATEQLDDEEEDKNGMEEW